MQELELKIVLNEALERRLRAGISRSGFKTGNPATANLRSVYFDTHDHKLREAGIALRLRKQGRNWVQTVKSGKSITAGLSNAAESECPAPGGRLDLARIPDEKMRAQLLASLKGGALAPVCESKIRRRTYQLSVPDTGEVELAIDAGEIRAGTQTAPLREAELELKAGDPGAIYAVARRLFPDGGVEFSNLSKSERGFLLAAEGHIMQPLEPRKARPVAVEPEQTAVVAAKIVLRECLDQVATNMLAVSRSDDPEGTHQLRVGLRRLRAALSIFRRMVAGDEAARLKGEARWLGASAGRMRDLGVALNDIVGPEAAGKEDMPGFPALLDALAREACAERARLVGLLTGARGQSFLLDLAAFVETGEWLAKGKARSSPVGEIARRALRRDWRRCRKRARGIEALSLEARHDLRKAMKRLRYTAEFMAPLYSSKATIPFINQLKNMQDLFGDLNDSVMIGALFSGPGAPAADDAAAQRAAGFVIGRRIERAEQDWVSARARWEALCGTQRFWESA
jgi:inorganic triphosphatase YgiF